ncbi:YdcF family protein [Maridesulfovibrio sp.]|uniref:YdcF family protein n=1 Tax=Maridesulfovibrio sp. TaxID=2795000 RepID=UPI002A18C8A6|nr:YdcF family protein [Maridesulfovibrio sp.]
MTISKNDINRRVLRTVRRVLTAIGALCVAGFAAAVLLFFMAPTLLQQQDRLEKADAIVVLGGQYFRPIYAAELYNKGYAPLVLTSKPVMLSETKTLRELGIPFPFQWEVFRDVLLKKGVPADRIEFFGHGSISTIEEAEELKKHIGTRIKSIILVTSPLHTGRAGIIFREVLPPDVKIILSGTPYEKVPEKWWTDFRTAPFVVMEVLKTVYYELGGAFRRSDQPTENI